MASLVERTLSVSSMRSRNLPPWWRANSQLNKAVRAPPMCRNPVGEGAKRVTTAGVWVALTRAFSKDAPMAPVVTNDARAPSIGDEARQTGQDVPAQRFWRP